MSHFTVNTGPPVLLDHQDPHFNAQGSCVCGCPACARDIGRAPGVVLQDCICPDCPCTGGEPS